MLVTLISIVVVSCRNNTDKFNYETSIASKVYEAQLKYLDLTIVDYARISKTGAVYFEESTYLDKIAKDFQSKIRNGEIVTENEKKAFYEHFEMTFKKNGLIDFEILNQLKGYPIKTVSDVDILRIYMKNNYVCMLLNNKLMPFNSWSTMAATKDDTIRNGQSFEVKMANTAWDSQQPNEWYLVKKNKDSCLTKENIIDTLHQDRDGEVAFSTKNYKLGKNKLIFISKMITPTNDRMLSRVVVFYVK
jgi:hypothetical protein